MGPNPVTPGPSSYEPTWSAGCVGMNVKHHQTYQTLHIKQLQSEIQKLSAQKSAHTMLSEKGISLIVSADHVCWHMFSRTCAACFFNFLPRWHCLRNSSLRWKVVPHQHLSKNVPAMSANAVVTFLETWRTQFWTAQSFEQTRSPLTPSGLENVIQLPCSFFPPDLWQNEYLITFSTDHQVIGQARITQLQSTSSDHLTDFWNCEKKHVNLS